MIFDLEEEGTQWLCPLPPNAQMIIRLELQNLIPENVIKPVFVKYRVKKEFNKIHVLVKVGFSGGQYFVYSDLHSNRVNTIR